MVVTELTLLLSISVIGEMKLSVGEQDATVKGVFKIKHALSENTDSCGLFKTMLTGELVSIVDVGTIRFSYSSMMDCSTVEERFSLHDAETG